MKTDKEKQLLAARAPRSLVAMLDKAASTARRTRSAEMLLRLEQSFGTTKVGAKKRGA